MKYTIHKASIPLTAVAVIMAVSGCQKNYGPGTDNSTNLFVATNSTSESSPATNATAPDNSGKNVSDRNGASQTPIDQGNSAADLQITQQIRKQVVSGTNNFSVTAQNNKIITYNGQVTLRGPVQTDAEKSSIDSIAKSVAGETNVIDQLEVKNNP
jgi:osmotically-inducible protein OsmY